MSTQSVVTAIRVLETVSEFQPIGLSELARRLEASKATVFRALTTLETLSWVVQGEGGGLGTDWSLTPHAYSVAVRGGAMRSLRDAALGPMSALQLKSTETVHLAVPDGDALVLAERIDTSHALRAFLALGSRVPLHASATGLAFLSASTDRVVERYLGGALERVSPRTITDPERLWDEIRIIRGRGFAINEEGMSEGITSVGAPIVNQSGVPMACVSISGPSSRVTPDRFVTAGEAVRATAKEIALRIEAQWTPGT
ncbi:IclR family transcriptional regulator [Leucobacter sp. M11]|uniref:IclR family transcriptional regulator n=1 Tax=Leucobacter sp. M11 TaxID=2993565 RepID=UPI002D7E27CD|nr:IclR family transcriptional regulator [Leucobacter sp. M11]MEB4615377.1 IclR family transcriptional regulator [Leucobacter sp. M11]